MRRRNALAAPILLSAIVLVLQSAPSPGACPDATQDIATDRPSVTNSSSVVPAASLQTENGVDWTSRAGQDVLDGPDTRMRLGLGGCTELLIDLPDYLGGVSGHGPSGFSSVAPAFKHQFDDLPVGTTLSVTAGLTLPTGAVRISGSGYNPYLQFPWTQDLGDGWTAGGMLSTTWLTGRPQSATVVQPSFLIDRQVSAHADIFAEYIGDFQNRGLPAEALNFGGSYRLTSTQQIDFHAGFGLNRQASNYFVGIGYSLRFDGLW